MDKYELCRSVLIQLNSLEVRGIQNCQMVSDMAGKLNALIDGMAEEDKRNEQLNALKDEQIKRLTTPKPQEGETVVGGEVYVIGDDPK